MRKKLLIILFIGIICFGLVGCNSKDDIKVTIKDTAELNEAKGVTMTIKKGTLTRSGATIVITDLSGKNNIYGQEYRLDKKENGKWKEMEVIYKGNYGWIAMGYTVDKNNKLEFKMDWEWLYGKLESGEYRIVKSTSRPLDDEKYYFSVEFIIE